MHRLAERLSLPRYAAVGIMESLWHMAATKAPTGDITAIGAEDIAFYVRWDREPSELIEALVACRWVDRDGDRLLIHDWKEHAEDSVKKWLSRHGMKFADNSIHTTQCPDMSRHVVPAIALAVADASAEPRQAAPEETDLSADADAIKPKRAKRKPKPEAEPKPPAPYTRFTDYFCDEWQAKYAAKYPFKTKDGTAAAAIWKYVDADLDWGLDIIDRFFACEDKFYAGHQLTRLNGDLAKFVGEKPEPNGPTVDWRPPTDEETAQIRADFQALPKEEQEAFKAMLKLHEPKRTGTDHA